MTCDILISNCSVLTPDYNVAENMSIAIRDSRIAAIDKAELLSETYTAKETIDGRGKLAMPGLVDGHTHVCQHLLRGRISDEFPMIWTRFLVPFESNLEPDDVYWSTQLACLQMIRSGTTAFADAGGTHMNRAADAVLESGLRAAIARSVMDQGGNIPDSMKDRTRDCIEKTVDLYQGYHGKGNGRIQIYFGLRQLMSCSEELIRLTGDYARQLKTGVHTHLAEHKDEVVFCLENFHLRPVEYLHHLGLVGENLLAAHCVAISEAEIDLISRQQMNVVHFPRANFCCQGFPKTPRLLETGAVVGLGSDGAARDDISIFEEMKTIRVGLTAAWGLPIFDSTVLPNRAILRMALQGGASALGLKQELGALEPQRKADIILLDIRQPHLYPSHNLTNTLAEAANAQDVTDSIINGAIVMRNREVLTLDEERILAECAGRARKIFERAGI